MQAGMQNPQHHSEAVLLRMCRWSRQPERDCAAAQRHSGGLRAESSRRAVSGGPGARGGAALGVAAAGCG